MIALQLNNLGLMTFINQVSQVPPGAMQVAMNAVIDRPGVCDTRRGFKQWGTSLTTPINKMFAYAGRLIAHHATKLAYDSDGNGTWVDYGGTFVAISGDKIRSTLANGNLYLNTNNGPYKIDSLTNNPYAAGGPPGLDIQLSLVASASGFLSNNNQCAYRVTWIYTDANNNLVEGTPSMAATILNNAGSNQNVSLTFTVPSGLTTAYSYRIYRTLQGTATPGDTFQLAYQAALTQAQINALSVTVTDVTPDALLGTTLYTSPGQQGQFQTNDPPPLCKDLCTFQGMTLYANCQSKQQFYITLVSVGTPNGIQINDTISLVGTSTRTYTGQNANNFAAQQFAVVTGGTISSNIDNTARNIVAAINQDPGNTQFYAYYVSGFNQLPGQILIQARNFTQGTFYATCSRVGPPSPFSPALPSSGTSYASSNVAVTNGVYISKVNQPEAVPVTNLIFVGPANATIYRIIPLRIAVIVSTSVGVFRITGTSPSSLSVSPYDLTLIQFGIETAATLNNSVYMNTTQGVVAISESGGQIMSRNVEGDLLQYAAPTVYVNFLSHAFGVGYESDRKYVLFLDQNVSDAQPTLEYVYNWITQAFTNWDRKASCGIVNPADNRLYLGNPDGTVRQERKSYTLGDFADDEFAVNIVSFSGTSVVLTSAANAVIGQSLGQNVTLGQGGRSSVIIGVNMATNTITVSDNVTWTLGAATLYTPIAHTVQYTPLTCGFPTYVKRFSPAMNFIFSQANFKKATVSFSTDLYAANESVSISPVFGGGWGTFPWGTLPWGVGGGTLQTVQTMLTKNTMLGRWLNIQVVLNQAFTNMALDGVNGFYEIAHERTK